MTRHFHPGPDAPEYAGALRAWTTPAPLGATRAAVPVDPLACAGAADPLSCIARGTRIATPTGPVPVERLDAGDRLDSPCGQGGRLVWIGETRLTARELVAAPALRPFRIRAGALGAGCPGRDLVLAGGQRLRTVSGQARLMPVAALENGHSVHPCDPAGGIIYFHIMLDAPGLAVAEGLGTATLPCHPAALTLLDTQHCNELMDICPGLFLHNSRS